MLQFQRDSNETPYSSESSMNSSIDSCVSFSRLSFENLELIKSDSPENISLKPHRSSDSSCQALLSVAGRRKEALGLRDFRLVRQIGRGDIGRVYLCRLCSSGNDGDQGLYALKVVDKEVLAVKKKTERAEMERKILNMVAHPFLPTLYAEFEASHFSCVVMEYCSGGDLHSLRHKQPFKRFSLSSARFYAAEVLVALEYLHMLGIIYRDLKPENILVRSDGHIMLSDFDLSLCSDAIPVIESPNSPPNSPRRLSPFSCLSKLKFRSKKIQTLTTNRLFVAEPVTARSFSFVGTHEYVAPEVASGMSHGNAVDWWALGIFIYEMIYGRTPFSADTNEATLRNIVKKPLTFPPGPPSTASEMHARNLISGLLLKDPGCRIGARRGAAEVKTHPFFNGLNFALVRSITPPEIPCTQKRKKTMTHCRSDGKKSTAFDYF